MADVNEAGRKGVALQGDMANEADIERVFEETTKALGPIKKVVAKDKYTVVFELSGAYADLPLQLGNTFARIVAKENVDKINSQPIGTGPFSRTRAW